MALPESIRIVEVGPRDGLQNEPNVVATEDKRAFIERLAAAGLRDIEATSFVHPKRVPQLADADQLLTMLPAMKDVTVSALAPNERGLSRAIAAGIERIAVFTAASDTFTHRNINMSVEESMLIFSQVITQARSAGMTVRAYLSTAFVCPFEGDVPPARAAELTERLIALGADEVAISDTTGVATPPRVHETLEAIIARTPVERLALHLHDTCGTALANVHAGLQLGVTTFDSATGGFGGCPFAPGAAGNLATEDLVWFCQDMGVATGINLDALLDAAEGVAHALKTAPRSRQWNRLRGGARGSASTARKMKG
jgi:hydroxymethylglutaryl-CoA lyase